MKKQEAIDFIREELCNGRTIKQISSDLSEKLNAPKDVVEKFVKQTADEAVAVDFLTSDLPQRQAVPSSIVIPSTEPLPGSEGKEAAPIREPRKPASGIPTQTKETPPFISDEEVAGHSSTYDFVPKPEFDEAAMEKFILRELGRQRKQSDVVLRLCEATGMHWDQAQKAVARVAARNNKKLVTNQNMITIPLCVIALIAGLGLLFAGISEGLALQNLITNPAALSPVEMQILYGNARQLLWAFLIGLALSIGGLVGLILAVKKQMGS